MLNISELVRLLASRLIAMQEPSGRTKPPYISSRRIGQGLGGKDHTTALHRIKTMVHLIATVDSKRSGERDDDQQGHDGQRSAHVLTAIGYLPTIFTSQAARTGVIGNAAEAPGLDVRIAKVRATKPQRKP